MLTFLLEQGALRSPKSYVSQELEACGNATSPFYRFSSHKTNNLESKDYSRFYGRGLKFSSSSPAKCRNESSKKKKKPFFNNFSFCWNNSCTAQPKLSGNFFSIQQIYLKLILAFFHDCIFQISNSSKYCKCYFPLSKHVSLTSPSLQNPDQLKVSSSVLQLSSSIIWWNQAAQLCLKPAFKKICALQLQKLWSYWNTRLNSQNEQQQAGTSGV